MTNATFNLSEESTFELISLLRHNLDDWAEFYTEGNFCPSLDDSDVTEENICQVLTDELKTHLPWKILNQLRKSTFFNTQKTAKEYEIERLKRDIEKALNPWNIKYPY